MENLKTAEVIVIISLIAVFFLVQLIVFLVLWLSTRNKLKKAKSALESKEEEVKQKNLQMNDIFNNVQNCYQEFNHRKMRQEELEVLKTIHPDEKH